jgi:peptidoglycan/xylan/chitin deacetylase (PgdA/CDA1 family)
MEYKMKHKLRNLIILLIGLSGLSFLYRVYRRWQGPLVRVLCFHDVADGMWFENVMNLLVAKYQLITPEEFHQQKFNPKKINILLTFDDGYQSWVDNCLPILNKYQSKGIFFINSGLLDIAEDEAKVAIYMKGKLLISPKKTLTWAGAKQLVAAGHTIGGHTVTHPNLALLKESEADVEIMDDKKRLESKLNIKLEDFAYPFGTKSHVSERLICLVQTYYLYQYSAITSFHVGNKNELIPRTLIEKDQRISQIDSWIRGSYDIFDKNKNLCVR